MASSTKRAVSPKWLSIVHIIDGRNPASQLGCIKPCKFWDKLPTSTGAGCLPSTVFADMKAGFPLVQPVHPNLAPI